MKKFLIKSLMVGSMIAAPLLYSTTAQASSSISDLKSEANPEKNPLFSPILNASSANLGKDEQVTNNLNRNFNAFANKDEEWEKHNPHVDKSEQDLKFEIASYEKNLISLRNEFADLSDTDKIKSTWQHILALNDEIKSLKQHLINAPAQDQQRADQAQKDLEAKKQKFIETGIIDN